LTGSRQILQRIQLAQRGKGIVLQRRRRARDIHFLAGILGPAHREDLTGKHEGEKTGTVRIQLCPLISHVFRIHVFLF
jgi:hypothetical protein